MEQVIQFLNNAKNQVVSVYSSLIQYWPLQHVIRLWQAMLIALALIILIVLFVVLLVKAKKDRNVSFYALGSLHKRVVTKYKKPIKYPAPPVREGYKFLYWCRDKKCKVRYEKKYLDCKSDLNLFAKLEKIDEEGVGESVQFAQPQPQPQYQPQPQPQYQPQYQPQPYAPYVAPPVSYGGYVENVYQEAPVTMGPAYFYDEIRYAMLGYERASQFKKLGVTRKQIIAEMFEKDGVVNLYLKVDPLLLQEKGYKVDRYQDSQFAIVPCKKEIKSKEDLDEALCIIKEAMTINNLIKSEVMFMQRPVSTEQSRRSGFAFFVKNENIATTADDYYRLLRAIVLSYEKSATLRGVSADNKMILKIYKKAETVYVYLALNPIEEGLENVSYDRNFIDTPAMFVVNTAEDCSKANEYIEKLMYRYGMERKPEKAEISLEDPIEVNCGFGYRIRN